MKHKLRETNDVLFVHPPAIYDFRKRRVFPGPIAYTVGESTDQFIIPPIGTLSMADYLDRNGYRAIVDNLGERMVEDATFDAERHIAQTSAKVYAIDLHWCVHSQGAIGVAMLCKKLHPESVVILGGLTSTRFSTEIIQKYGFVDAVIRGEAEKPLLQFMHNLEMYKEIRASPNLTFRSKEGEVKEEPLMKPSEDIDEFEFTRISLLEPKGSIVGKNMPPHWSLPICRGCVYNCASCAGSAYSYKTYLGREKPSFRSPKKIVEDIRKLCDQGVRGLFLFMDPRMGGRKYRDELISTMSKEKIDLERLSMELFSPADEEYVGELAKIRVPTTLTISPESGDGSCRMAHGRQYSNEALLKTIETCQKHSLHLMIFFMLGMADDTPETVKASWSFWEKICSMNKNNGTDDYLGTVIYSFGPMILLDPGSLAFDFPEKYGYRLISKNLEDYVNSMALPSWHQWISYETKHMDRETIARLTLDSIEQSIKLRQKYGVYSRFEAVRKRIHYVDANRLVIKEVERVMKISDADEKSKALDELKKRLDSYEAPYAFA
jgi:B12-binding domain/radical SAM domain protein